MPEPKHKVDNFEVFLPLFKELVLKVECLLNVVRSEKAVLEEVRDGLLMEDDTDEGSQDVDSEEEGWGDPSPSTQSKSFPRAYAKRSNTGSHTRSTQSHSPQPSGTTVCSTQTLPSSTKVLSASLHGLMLPTTTSTSSEQQNSKSPLPQPTK